MKRKNTRNSIFYVLMGLALIFFIYFAGQRINQNGEEVTYSEFLRQVKANNVSSIMYSRQDAQLFGLNAVSKFDKEDLPGSYDFFVYVEESLLGKDLTSIAAVELKMPFDDVDSSLYNIDDFSYAKLSSFSILSLIPTFFMIALVGFSFYWIMKQQGGGSDMSNFGKSKAKDSSSDTSNKVTFADVAGADEEKQELVEVIEFLKDPKRFSEMGARIPKGVLLMGPPGTGKTLLAKAVAGEAGAPFYSMSGSDFVEMYVGVGARRVRDLFATAKKTAPAIIFIDEIDAVGRHRGAGLGGGHDEREQTLNQMLVEMDGFDPYAGVIVIAATNRPDILDPALLRPGRFDRTVVVNKPDVKGREAILKVHSKDKPLGPDVDLAVIASRTPGFTGADLENIMNEAAILTVRVGKTAITMIEVEEAVTRVVAGPEKKSRIISEEDKKITAYHEAGHAVVGRNLKHADPVHEISIIQRGMAAGYTMTLPEDDKQHITRGEILDQICMLLGGRTAEEIFCNDISSGAYNDIQRVTDLAKSMVTEYGMSEKVGTIFLGNGGEQEVFLGRDISSHRQFSEKVSSVVDEEIARIVNENYTRALGILSQNKEIVETVVGVLMINEKVTGVQFENLCLMQEGKIQGKITDILEYKEIQKPIDASELITLLDEENADNKAQE